MQSEQHWELMIVDDHSSDNSLNIVKQYAAKDPRIKVLKTPIQELLVRFKQVIIILKES